MSLDRYRRARMVVLHSRASVHAAARVLADNHVGSILVTERRQLLGIVTDRDLALEIVAGDLAHTTPVHDVMSDEVAAAPITVSVEDVVRTMRERGCRRVPLVEDGKLVGLVKLEDLIHERLAPAHAARASVNEFLPGERSERAGGMARRDHALRGRPPSRGEVHAVSRSR